MKIGILTLPLNINYGGILQAYALQTVLERMGHQVSVFNKRKEYPLPKKRFLVYLKRFVWHYILRKKNIHVFEEQYQAKVYPVTAQNTLAFVETYIHTDYTELSHLNATDFDALIVGSDQIWRPQYYKPIENAYLDFAVGWSVKRIAYAASFGTDHWEYSPRQEAQCKDLARNFEAVSVRESGAVEMVKKHFGIKAEHVVDPTLLLEKEDYIQLIERGNTNKSMGDLLVYVLDETTEKQAFINKIAQDYGLVPFRVNSRAENWQAPLQERIQPPVEQWLRGFYDAKVIITDSFHACVFSIIFQKPFMVFGNPARGLSRLKSLLEPLGLMNNIISSDSKDNASCNVNYQHVEQEIKKYKEKSLDFLHSALDK